MGSASRRWALNLVIHFYGDELRDEVSRGLPTIVKLVLEAVELRPGDAELLADAVIPTSTVPKLAWVSPRSP